MLVPNFSLKLLRSSFVLKLFVAGDTSIVLYTSSLSVLLYLLVSAVWALFLCIVRSF